MVQIGCDIRHVLCIQAPAQMGHLLDCTQCINNGLGICRSFANTMQRTWNATMAIDTTRPCAREAPDIMIKALAAQRILGRSGTRQTGQAGQQQQDRDSPGPGVHIKAR